MSIEKGGTPQPGDAQLAEATTVLEQLVAVYEGVGLTREVGVARLEPGESDRREEVRFRTLVENIPAVFFMAFLDEVLGEAYVSPHIEELLGFSNEEWLGDPVLWYKQIHVDDKARWSEEAAQLVVSGEPVDSVYRVHARDGRVIHFRCRVGIGRDEHGRPLFVHGVGVDITELKENEEELRRGIRQLERANADLEQFAYTAAHDLRTPLRQVHSYAQLLEMNFPEESPEAVEYLSMILGGIRKLEALVNDIGSYSGLRGGEEPERVDLNEVLEEVRGSLLPSLEANGATLEVSSRLPVVLAHRSHLLQLLQNLLENALKYRHADRAPAVKIEARERSKQWEISVSDNGIGIAEEYRDKVFLVFERLHASDAYEGTGIGLATCKKIVELLGGRIWVDGNPGQGSTFHFTLPRVVEDGRAS